MFSQEKYIKALTYAAKVHGEQKTPYGLPYLTHISTVTMEVIHACEVSQIKEEEANLAIQVALLHDVIEDTEVTFEDIMNDFSEEVAIGVDALTKDKTLSKKEQMQDSINKLLTQPYYIQMVKLADRVTNMQKPPQSWDNEKIFNYLNEAKFIFSCLKNSNSYLSKRLEEKIGLYRTYVS